MRLITTYDSNASYINRATLFRYKSLYFFTSWLYSSFISIEAFDTWIQKGSITKTGKPNEIS